MIGKSCPKCVTQVPVACKACPCGYSFFNAKRNILTAAAAAAAAAAITTSPSISTTTATIDSTAATEDGAGRRRRTERVKRGKPNYYDATEYDKQTKKRVRKKSGTDSQGNQKKLTTELKSQLKKKKKKIDKDSDDKDSTMINFPDDSVKSFIILAEINRRFGSVSSQP